MVNITEFTKRLLKVMDYYQINASTLADELGIQRSGISHLLSERNKPSLDFVLKLTEKFPEVSIEWLTLGKGEFPSTETSVFNDKTNKNKSVTDNKYDLFSYQDLETKSLEISSEKTENHHNSALKKQIKKIIFFYDDNSFEIFEN